MSQSKRIGFVGLGAMGRGMAFNFVTKGYPLTVLGNRNCKPVEELCAQGAAEAEHAADLAARSDIVFICVRNSEEVERIVLGDRGLLAGARSGLAIIDCTTSRPESTAMLRDRAAETGVEFIDAPLGRSVKEALEGRLNVMVGATPEQFARLKPVLTAIAENIFHVGGPGSGHKAKLVNNFIAMGYLSLLAEGFTAADRAGVDSDALMTILSNGPVACPMLKAVVPSIQAGTYDGVKFELDTARKDLRYYTHLAETLHLPTLLGDAVHQMMTIASMRGFGQDSVVSVARAFESHPRD
jgi:3-hydroxyisobutyrate dehydrogenase-like beta-hydroxyacid dehydrogenase